MRANHNEPHPLPKDAHGRPHGGAHGHAHRGAHGRADPGPHYLPCAFGPGRDAGESLIVDPDLISPEPCRRRYSPTKRHGDRDRSIPSLCALARQYPTGTPTESPTAYPTTEPTAAPTDVSDGWG
jgi:hypothetical protein